MHRVTRRRALVISAATACLGLGGSGRADLLHRWEGSALGAMASLTLHHPDRRRARRLIEAAVAEVDRLERIFSLQRADSAISRLNRDGRLTRPPLDLVAVLETAARVSSLSDGAFDITVQPLWRLFASHPPPAPRVVEAAARLVDWQQVVVSRSKIALGRPRMAITLNGIAQGYITDRVADLLRDSGLDHALVDLGEQRAVGTHPNGEPWRVWAVGKSLLAEDRAIAVSGASLTPARCGCLSPSLIDPHRHRPVAPPQPAIVIARRAMIADALSTALAAAGAGSRAFTFDLLERFEACLVS